MVTSEFVLWLFGWCCVYELLWVVVNVGFVLWFLIAFGVVALVFVMVLRWCTLVVRVVVMMVAVLVGVGVCVLVGGFGFVFVYGCVVGVLLVWLVDVVFVHVEGGRCSRCWSLIAAFVGGLVVFVMVVIMMFGVEAVVALIFVVGCVVGVMVLMEAVPAVWFCRAW